MGTTRPHGRRLAVVAADGKRLPDPPGSAADPGNALSVAVLPFAGPGGPDEQAFGDGIAEDIIMELSRFQNLTVIPRGVSFACRGLADDTARVARELGVQFVLEGSIRRAADRVRVSVRLLEGATGRLLSSERLERPAQDLLAVQEEVARRIAAEMAAEMDAESLRRAERLPLSDLSVQDMVLRARAMLLRGSEAEDAQVIDGGVELARAATAREPYYAEAWRVLAWGLCVRGERGLFGTSAQADYAAADEAATRLRVLEPNSYAAHGVLGHIAMRQGRHAEALESLRHAYALNPNSMVTLRWLSWEESNHGLAGLARDHAELSLQLSPHDHMAYLGHWVLAVAHWVGGELPDCAEHVRRAVALTPRFGGYYMLLAACLAEQGLLAEAAEAAARVRQNCPGLIESRLAGNTYFADPRLAARYRAALARAAGVPDPAESAPAASAPRAPSRASRQDASDAGLSPALAALTGREREILRLVAQGKSNAAVADALGISEHTAKRHISNILLKLDLPTRSAAAMLAGRHGLI